MKQNYGRILIALALVSVFSACGGGSKKQSDPPPVNQAPTANAGTDQSVDEGAAVNLVGTGADSDGTIASYAWLQDSGTAVAITNSDMASASFTSPMVAANEDLVFILTVTDNDDATGSDTVTVTVNDVLPPIVKSWSTPVMLTDGYRPSLGTPQLAVNDDGNAMATWSEAVENPGGPDIASLGRHFSVSTGWDVEEVINLDYGHHQIGITIQDNGHTNVILPRFWQSGASIQTVEREHQPGVGWGPTVLVDDNQSLEPAMNIDVNGNAAVIYKNQVSNSLIANSRNSGSPWRVPYELEATSHPLLDQHKLVMRDDGHAIAVWTFRGEPTGPYTPYLKSSTYTPTVGWSLPVQIDSSEGPISEFDLAFGDSDYALAVWVQTVEQQQPDESYDVLNSARFSLTTGWSSPERVRRVDDYDPTNPEVVIDAGGNATAFWFQERLGSSPIEESIWTNTYPAGAGWEIETDTGFVPEDRTRMIFDDDGNGFLVAGNGEGNILLMEFSSTEGWKTTGLPGEPKSDLGDYAGIIRANPVFQKDASGNILMIWRELEPNAPRSREGETIWASRYQ